MPVSRATRSAVFVTSVVFVIGAWTGVDSVSPQFVVQSSWSQLWFASSMFGSFASRLTTSGYAWAHRPLRKIVAGVFVCSRRSMIRISTSGTELRLAYMNGYMSASKVRAIHFFFDEPWLV